MLANHGLLQKERMERETAVGTPPCAETPTGRPPRRIPLAAGVAGLSLCAFMPVVPAQAQPPRPLASIERVVGDATGGSTEHYSIDQHGSLPSNPTEFVSVGARALPAGGQALHILRYGTNLVPFGEALWAPTLSSQKDMVGYSVDTMANGELLIAGEVRDPLSGTGTCNVFVCRMTANLLTVRWCRLLPGSLNQTPSVTARELRDGSIIVAHNEWTTNGDLGPGVGRLTRLTSAGGLIWSQRYVLPAAPLGQIGFADVRQKPASAGNDLWVVGFARAFLTLSAMVLEVDVNTGALVGECGSLHPHPDFDHTTFASIYFDVRPNGTYSAVMAGAAFDGDLIAVPRPRVVDVSSSWGPANWDRVFDVGMTPAPTALTVRRAASSPGLGRIVVAGTESSPLAGLRQARIINLDGNANGAFVSGWTFGRGAPTETAFNDICDAQVMIGSRHADINGDGVVDLFDPEQIYIVGRGGSSCAVRCDAVDLGPGTWSFFCPLGQREERILDLPLMSLPRASYDETICASKFAEAPALPAP